MATSQEHDISELTKYCQNDQGPHECEVTFEGEEGLLKQQNECEKNPGHTEYIPITEFTKEKLTPYCNSDDIFNVFQNEAALVVRVVVSYTSKARPDNYPFSKCGGSHAERLGTGWVRWARDKFTEKDNKPCPCSVCRCSPSPKKEWGRVYVRTAHHVVFDTSEAEFTKCLLFFDSPGDSKTDFILQGVAVTLNKMSDDRCELTCITHDLTLWEKLYKLDDQREYLFEKANREYFKNNDYNTDQLIVIISHPHGCNKQVSIGRCVERQKIGPYDYTCYSYTACTCRGSSGAPVYIFGGGRRLTMARHPHSRYCEEPGVNTSGMGWD